MTEQREKQLPAEGRARRWGEVAVVCLLAAVAAWLCLSGNWGSEFWWNDAARHAMDGVFFLDLVRDLPESLALKRYATEYYARYPCLGLIQYPPFFPAIEAVCFAVFGVSVATARATVAAFGAAGAIFGYLVARRFVGRWGAVVFVLLFVTAPGVVYWSRDVMLEMPVMAMMLVSSYLFLGYVDEKRRGYGVAAGVFLALAALTKQQACCLAPAWVVYALWRRGWRILWQRESLAAAGVAALLLAPFVVVTLLYSPVNVGQVFGDLDAGIISSRWSWASIAYYPRRLPGQVGAVCLVAIGALVVGAAARRLAGCAALGSQEGLRGVVYAALWVATSYVMLTFAVLHKETRFLLIWVPGLAFLGASGIVLLASGPRLARLAARAATGLLALQAVLAIAGWPHDLWAMRSPWVGGTQKAARWVAALPRGTVVFYAGRYNGNLIFNVRRFDPNKKVVVLRASKLLFSVATIRSFGKKVYAHSQEDILEILRDYGVRYLLVEDRTPALDRVASVLKELRALVRSPRFVHRAVYPITSDDPELARNLHLYEVLDAKPARVSMLEMDMLAAGGTLRVPLRRLGIPISATARPRVEGP